MINKILVFIFLSIYIFSSSLFLVPIQATDQDDYDIIYFGSKFCSSCQALENSGIFEELTNDGYRLKKYIIEDDRKAIEKLHNDYLHTYKVPVLGVSKIPIIFVGDTFFAGRVDIENAINNNTIQSIASSTSLLELSDAPFMNFTMKELFTNLGVTIFMGLGDAFNVCAIAMLLMFISFLASTKNKKAIAFICLSYISAIFIMYFIIGALLAQVFLILEPYFFIFAWVIVILAFILLILNLYDFIMVRQNKYQNIKNKLPKGAFKITRRLMENFSNRIESGSSSVYVIAFLIGIVVALIEFPCTGQVYISWLAYMTQNMTQNFVFYLYLFFYNLLFISPLIVISIIAIKSQSIASVSNFMREHMGLIKLLNVLIFLFVIVYYLFIIL